MGVIEKERQDDGGFYELTIVFPVPDWPPHGNSYIETTRCFQVLDGKVFPLPYKFDAPEQGRFADFWKAVRDSYMIKYDDLIDAIIYVTDTEKHEPALTGADLDEMFSAQSEMDVTGR